MPNCPPPPPLPIPGVSKGLLPVGKQIRKKHIFDDLHDFYKKQIKKSPVPRGSTNNKRHF